MESARPQVSVGRILERDVDLLLINELAACPAFASWFAQQCGADCRQVLAVQRSVISEDGESDVVWDGLTPDGQVVRYYIENKIDAGLQPRQAERYQERGVRDVSQQPGSSFVTVLVCPDEYRRGGTGFQIRVTYQAIHDTLQTCGRLTPVVDAILSEAIHRSRSGYQAIEHVEATVFWKHYYAMAKETALQLGYPEPTVKGRHSDWAYFRPSSLRRRIRLIHKLRQGNVDLQFQGMGRRMAELVAYLQTVEHPELIVARATKSASYRLRTPPVTDKQLFESQAEAIAKGLRTASRLLSWYELQSPEFPFENNVVG